LILQDVVSCCLVDVDVPAREICLVRMGEGRGGSEEEEGGEEEREGEEEERNHRKRETRREGRQGEEGERRREGEESACLKES